MTAGTEGLEGDGDEALRLLVVEDSGDDTLLLLRRLERDGYAVDARRVETAEEMADALERDTWDVILADYNLPRFGAPAALAVLHGTGLDLPFIIVSGSIGEERAVASLKAGAHDFVSKDNLARLAPAVTRELRDARVRRERRRAESELQETTAHLHHLVSATPAVIYTARAEPGYAATFVSENAAEILGHPARAFTASEGFWIDHVHPDDRHALERRLPDQIRGGRGSNEYRFLCGDGRYRWIRDEFRVEDAEKGEARVMGYRIDVTPRRVTEETLSETQEAYRALFEHSHDGIAITTGDGKILSANPALARLLDRSGGEIRECSALEFYDDPSDRDRFLTALERGSVRDFSLRLRSSDGQRLDTLVSAVPLTWSEEQAPGIISLIRDVTQQKRSKERLRESEERFRQLAEHIEDVFWVTTPDKSEMLYVSPAYERIWGRSPEELYRDPGGWVEAIHPDDRERVRQALPDQTRATYEYEEEYRVVQPDGEVRWVWDRGFPVRNDDGEVYRVVGVAEDVTDRIQLEHQLHWSQKMEDLGRLAEGVAHDFNNLLTIIRGQTELLLDDLSGSSPLRSEVEEIRHAAERAGQLTTQLLAFGKRQPLEPRVLDLNRSVLEMEKLLRRVIGEDVEMLLDLTEDVLPVRADPMGLGQVILNLAVNAREAMPGGGCLTLRTHEGPGREPGEILDAGDPSGSSCHLEVEDTGSGIEPDHLDRIFEPFFTTKEEGTGLGLATVYGIVEQSGGTVAVRSDSGAGTTFTIRLPRVDGGALSAGDRPGSPAGSGALSAPGSGASTGRDRGGPAKQAPRTVLVVDDDEALRPLIGRILRRSGHRAILAGTVEEGLRTLDANDDDLDLVITDVTLPDRSGMELAEELAKRAPGMPVLFISGYPEAAADGPDLSTLETAFLAKPFTPKALVRAISHLLAEAHPRSRRSGG